MDVPIDAIESSARADLSDRKIHDKHITMNKLMVTECCVCMQYIMGCDAAKLSNCWECKVCRCTVHSECIHTWFHKQPLDSRRHLEKDTVTCPVCRSQAVLSHSTGFRPNFAVLCEGAMPVERPHINRVTNTVLLDPRVLWCLMSMFFGDVWILLIIVNTLPSNSVTQTVSLVVYWLANCGVGVAIMTHSRTCINDPLV